MASFYNFSESPAPFEFHPELFMAAGDGSVWWDFGDETTMFQDISATVPVTASGDKVGLVLDKGPSGIHLFQVTTSKMPTFIIDGDQKFLRFDAGALQNLATGPSESIALNGCYGFSAFRTVTNGTYLRLMSAGKTGVVNDINGTGTFCINSDSNSGWFNLRANGGVLSPYFAGTGNSQLGLYEYSIRGANTAKVWKDGVLGVSDTSHPALDAMTDGRIAVGGMVANNEVSASSPFDGDCFGIMHFSRNLTPNEVATIRQWWNSERI